MKIGTKNDIKFLPKKNLIKLLEGLPDNALLATTNVGNLMVVVKDEDGEPEYRGYIDFLLDGEYCKNV